MRSRGRAAGLPDTLSGASARDEFPKNLPASLAAYSYLSATIGSTRIARRAGT